MNKWYPWLNIPYRQIIRQYLHRKVYHALLINKKLSKDQNFLISRLSRWILCTQSNSEKNCGKCRSCFLIKFGNHPDYHILSQEKKNCSIDIELIIHVRKKLYIHSQFGGSKFVFLFYYNTITDSVYHELIKILEEPPEKTYFLLALCEYDHFFGKLSKMVLYLHLEIPEKRFLLKWINNCIKENLIITNYIFTALKKNDLCPIYANHFRKKNIVHTRNKICTILNKILITNNIIFLLDLFKNKYREKFFYWLSTLLLDAIKLQHGSEIYIINKDQKKIIYHLSKLFSKILLQKILHNFFHLRYTLKNRKNINRIVLITEKLLRWEQCINTVFLN